MTAEQFMALWTKVLTYAPLLQNMSPRSLTQAALSAVLSKNGIHVDDAQLAKVFDILQAKGANAANMADVISSAEVVEAIKQAIVLDTTKQVGFVTACPRCKHPHRVLVPLPQQETLVQLDARASAEGVPIDA